MSSYIADFSQRPTAVVFSTANLMAINLVETLLGKQCQVYVCTDERKSWTKAMAHLAQNTNLKYLTFNDKVADNPSYVFIVEGFEAKSPTQSESRLKKSLAKIKDVEAKKTVVLPATAIRLEAVLGKIIDQVDGEIQTVFLGEVFGPRMKLSTDGLVNSIVTEALTKKKVRVPPQNFDLYFVYAGDAAEEVCRQTFAYGFSKKRILLAEVASYLDLAKSLQRELDQIRLEKDPLIKEPELVKSLDLARPTKAKTNAFRETVNWIQEYEKNIDLPKETPSVKKTVPQKTSFPKPRFLPAWLRMKIPVSSSLLILLAIILFWVLTVPFGSLFISGLTLKAAYGNIVNGKVNRANSNLKLAEQTAKISKNGFYLISALPVVGRPFSFAADTAAILEKASQSGERGLKIFFQIADLAENILQKQEDYDLSKLSQELYLELDLLYKELSFLQSEIDSLPASTLRLFAQEASLNKTRKYLNGAKNLVAGLPILLGETKPTTYLVLLQNNMELRPTGGFIGSFALVTFDQGHLIDIVVNDVYSADGQLKGHIEPPLPIKDYLGEANWYLRDSNWDPDFVVSAQRAEWFLEKELERSVDGVVGIDLEVARSVLETTGPVVLADFNQEINAQNLYERIQYEVESEFFPGSRKKANILTALTRAVLERVREAKQEELIGLGLAVLNNFEEKHLQLFLHHPETAKSLSSLGWDGAVALPTCEGNCQTIWAGWVEANVGVNKANYFVQRQNLWQVKLGTTEIEQKMSLTLKNNAPIALGVRGNYKVYLRLLTSSRSATDEVEIVEAQGTKTQELIEETIAGRKEYGLLVEVGPGQEKEIVFSWVEPLSIKTSQSGEVKLYLRKQAGIENLPTNIQVFHHLLTENQTASYNTDLVSDFLEKLQW